VKLKNAEIIIEAGSIPDGSSVRKITGTFVYTLKRNLKIYGPKDEKGNHQPIEHNGIFLMGETSINMISETLKLVWLNQNITVHDSEHPDCD